MSQSCNGIEVEYQVVSFITPITLYPTIADAVASPLHSSVSFFLSKRILRLLAMHMAVSRRYSVFQANMQLAASVHIVNFWSKKCHVQLPGYVLKQGAHSPHPSLFLKWEYRFDHHSLNNHLNHAEDAKRS